MNTNRARVAIHNQTMRTADEEFARPARAPDTTSWSAVREAAKDCEACHLYKRATQTVFGEGPKSATMMLVGEQPGDYEDVAGKPFVGPAGKIMDRGLDGAGIDRSQVYVTNAVKHFKWEARAGNAGFIRNRIRARSQPAVRGWKLSFELSGRTLSWQWVRRRRRPCSARDSESHGSVARCYP